MKPVFKQYNQNQLILLPPSLEELVPKNHPVRVVNKVVDQLNIDQILSQYKGGGTSSFDPRMLLKVLVYSYMINTYASRKIERLLQENIHFMWLSGMQTPDHNTINRFRSDKLKDILKQIFSEVVLMMHQAGCLDIKEIYTDGTKIEANANRYTFVWGRSIKTRREKILSQIQELWQYAENVALRELSDTMPTTYEEITPEKIEAAIENINNALKGQKVEPKVKQKINSIKKKWPQKLRDYQEMEKILKERNSYSKTDHDATFMRMKEDYMMNGQLKPGYNWQISTNNQMIVNYSIHQTASDTTTFKYHLEEYKKLYDMLPESVTADAGYGSEENYDYAEQNKIEAFIKYNYFHKEQKKKWFNDISKSEYYYYNQELDCFYCPIGQKMHRIETKTTTTKTGHKQTIAKYQAQNCQGCPLRSACHKSSNNRIIEVNHNAKRHRLQAKERLLSEEGLRKRSRRPIEPEAVFGNIKHNKKFKRFNLKSKPKVEIEIGLISIAHNLAKFAKIA